MRKLDTQITQLLTKESSHTPEMIKEAKFGWLNWLFLGAGVLPLAMAKLQQAEMESYNRGMSTGANTVGPIYAGMYGRYGGLGYPTSLRPMVGLEGQGMSPA